MFGHIETPELSIKEAGHYYHEAGSFDAILSVVERFVRKGNAKEACLFMSAYNTLLDPWVTYMALIKVLASEEGLTMIEYAEKHEGCYTDADTFIKVFLSKL